MVAVEVTDEGVGDSEKFRGLVREAAGNVSGVGSRLTQANADGAYDAKDNFNVLDEMGVTPVIKMRENASTLAKGSPLRKRCVREYRRLGYKAWRDKYGYGYRWRAEGNLSAVKRLAGEYASATKTENMFREVEMKFLFYNAVLKFDETKKVLWSDSG